MIPCRSARFFLAVAVMCLMGEVAVLALGADKAPAEKAPTEDIGPHTVTIRQEVRVGEMTVVGTYKGWFGREARFRIEGSLEVGPGQMKSDVVMASDGQTLRQVITTPLGAQFVVYDLKELRAVIPEFDPAQGYSPTAYRTLLEQLARAGQPQVETIGAEAVDVYTLGAASLGMTPPPGLPVQVPDIRKVKVWATRDTRWPRKVEGYTVREGQETCVMRVEFDNPVWQASIAEGVFRLEAPPGVVPIDGTALIKAWFSKPASKSGS